MEARVVEGEVGTVFPADFGFLGNLVVDLKLSTYLAVRLGGEAVVADELVGILAVYGRNVVDTQERGGRQLQTLGTEVHIVGTDEGSCHAETLH